MKPRLAIKAAHLALVIAVMVAIFLPSSYFVLGYGRLAIILQTEAEANALFATQIINTNPDYWAFEQARLQDFLSRHLIPREHEIRCIRKLNGEIVAQTRDKVRYPFIIRSHDLYESGNLAAKLEIIRSLRPLLWETTLVGIFGCLLVAVIYLPFKKYVLDIREEAKKALRESEKRFKDIAENALEWIWEVDAQGKYVYASPVVEKLLGYKPEEILNKHFYDLFHPDDRQELKEQAFAVFAAKQPFHEFHNRNLHKYGREVWLSSTGLPILDAKGDLIGYRGADTDITARRLVKEELRQARREWEEIFQAIGHSTMILDAEHRIIEANRATLAALGKDAAKIRGQKCYEFFHPGQDQQPADCPLEKLHASGHLETMEMEVEALEGIYLVSCTPMLDAQGRLEKVIHIVTDITERRRAEQALRESEENYRLLVKQIPALVFRGYADWSIDCFDHKIETLTGYPKDDFDSRRMKWSELILEEDLPGAKAKFLEALKGAGTYVREYRIRQKSGEVIWVHVQGQIFRDAAGEIDHISGLIFDISDRKRAEEALIASEANYRTIFNAVNDAIYIHDAHTGEVLDVNQKVLESTGYSLQELRNPDVEGLNLEEPPYTQEDALQWIKKAYSGEPQLFKWRGRAKSGRLYWLEVNLKRVTLGQKECVLAVARDITQRKETEEELARKKVEFEAIFNSMTDAVVFTDTQRRVIMANPAFLAMFGHSLEEITGETTAFLYNSQAEYEELGRTRYHVGAQSDRPIFEMQYRRKDGSRVTCETMGTLVNDSQGRTIGYMGIHRDISERKRAEEALIASEANYRTIFNAVNDGILVHDARTGTILDVNQNVLDFTKRSLEEIKGLNIDDITQGEPPYTHQEALAWIRKAAAGEPQLFRWRGKNRSGRLYWWEINLKRVNLGDKECVLAVARNITGRLLAQEALQESEKRYQSMFEDSPISLWQEDFSEVNAYLQTLRNQGVQDIRAYLAGHPGTVAHCANLVKLLDVNKATLKIYEAESKEELFQGLRYVIADESYQVFQQIIIALAEGRTVFEGEGLTQTLKGNKLHIITRLSVIPGFEQTLSRVLVSIIDMTERKRAEEDMRKYEFITSASKEYMTLINRDYVYEAANAAYCQAHQKMRDEVVGKTIAAIWGEQVFENIIKKYLDQCFSGRPVEFEGWFSFNRQAKGYYNVSYTPFFDVDGTVAYAAVVTHDITKRKEAEEALLESQKRYRSIFENAPIAIFQSTPEGKLTDVNPEAARSLGYASPQEMISTVNQTSIGETLYVDPQFRAAFMRRVSEGHGQWLEAEARLRRQDGGEIVARMLTRQLQGDSVKVEGFVEDITERLRAEEEKRQLESQLFQSQKMEAIGTLAGGIAHDFNNILASMLGYTELALDDTPEETDLRANLNQVLRGCQRAKELIKQILTFSRQDQQERKPVQVSLILKEVLKFLRASLPATIDIRQNIASSSRILANPTQIHQVLLNFCTNAAQAMEERGGVMDIALAEVDLPAGNQDLVADLAPGPYLTLTVSDTGKGMTPEVMNRIFEPFFTTKAPGQGTGLGLAVVHGIVKSHGGAIQVGSEPGKGSTFKAFFPKIEDQIIVEPATLTKIPKGRETILLVDDEKDLVELWGKTFKRLGYQVVGKSSSIEALETFQAKPDRFDLVITDQTMPQMTGLSLAQELLRLRPELPIILCTGFADPVKVEDIKALGIREMVNKPLSKAEIAIIIRKVLDQES